MGRHFELFTQLRCLLPERIHPLIINHELMRQWLKEMQLNAQFEKEVSGIISRKPTCFNCASIHFIKITHGNINPLKTTAHYDTHNGQTATSPHFHVAGDNPNTVIKIFFFSEFPLFLGYVHVLLPLKLAADFPRLEKGSSLNEQVRIQLCSGRKDDGAHFASFSLPYNLISHHQGPSPR